MPHKSHKIVVSHFGLYRHYWRLKCCEKPILLGKTLLMFSAVTSVRVVSAFSYSWILMFL